jgi:dTDP-glucose 4,6-dehydratase
MIAIVTGGAGFIGSELVRQLLLPENSINRVVVFDNLSYAGNQNNLPLSNEHLSLEVVDIASASELERAWKNVKALGEDTIVVYHLAAESHVDRSILSGEIFSRTNVVGTQLMLESSSLNNVSRFLHVSTDEVYGSLNEGIADESYPLNPSSAYSASKAGSDLAVMAHQSTHKLDTLISRCVNNYGPLQMPEKFVPRMINRALKNEPLPIFGDGHNSREWIHVSDHAKALINLMKYGNSGEIYNIGTGYRVSNIDLARNIIELASSKSEINFVVDRKGHDFRYALNSDKLRVQLKWDPQVDFIKGLQECITHIEILKKDVNYQERVMLMEGIYVNK